MSSNEYPLKVWIYSLFQKDKFKSWRPSWCLKQSLKNTDVKPLSFSAYFSWMLMAKIQAHAAIYDGL